MKDQTQIVGITLLQKIKMEEYQITGLLSLQIGLLQDRRGVNLRSIEMLKDLIVAIKTEKSDLVYLQMFKGTIAIPVFNVLQADLQAVQMLSGQHRDRQVIQVCKDLQVVHPEAQVFKDQILVAHPGVPACKGLPEVQEADLQLAHPEVPIRGVRQAQRVAVEEDIDLPPTLYPHKFYLKKGNSTVPLFLYS